jgi:hypothetical protein
LSTTLLPAKEIYPANNVFILELEKIVLEGDASSLKKLLKSPQVCAASMVNNLTDF